VNRRALSFLAIAALLLLAGGHAVAAEPLPTDPAIVRGELENGLRYVVRQHAHPPGRAVVWMHVHSGSLNETDRQRGIAHYLEHMAFNGSENFPPGSLIRYFESLGMTFGRDQNAFTNMEQTTYQLSLPDAKPETLGKGMTYFADVLSRLLLLPKEIDGERQIILEERRRGLGGRQRTRDAVMARISPGSLWSKRETIGLEETILGVVEKDFRDYYGAWYAASNATVLVVADADPAVVVKAIAAAFGGAPKRPRPVPHDPGVVAFEKSFAVVASDPEVQSEEVRITRLEPVHPPATTVERWRDDLVLALGEAAFNRRMEDKIARGGTSLSSLRADSGDEGRTLHSAELTARPLAGKWKAALEEAALELLRARAFGFTEHEVEDAKKERLSGAERDVETDPTAPASTLIRRMNGSVGAEEPMLSAGQRLELLRRFLPAVKPEDVAKRFAVEYDPKAVAFVAVLPAGPAVPTEAQLLEAGTKALAVEPTRDVEVAHAASLMAELPKPGKSGAVEEHAATKVSTASFENGVVVHHRFMDTQKDEVTVEISLVGGELLETAANRGVTSAALVAWRSPATKTLSSGDVRELMTGKKVSVRGGAGGGGGGRGRRGGRGAGGGVGGGSVSLTVSGSPAELETGLQLAHLLLTQPRVEAAAFEQHRANARQAFAEASRNPAALGLRFAGSAPYPDADARLQPATPEQTDKVSLEAAQAWIEKLVRESPVEVAVVGDLPREKAMELVARYLGSLPARDKVSPDAFRALRALERPVGPRRIDKTVDTATDQAFVSSAFYGPDETDRPRVRALNVARQILSTRLTSDVREKQQLVYSIAPDIRAGGVYPGFGVIAASATTQPHKTAALVDALAAVYAKFAADGPTDEEMSVARKQVAVALDEQERDPGFWLTRLGLMAFRGLRLDDMAADAAAYQALTAKDLKEVVAKYCVPANSIVVVVKPASAGPSPAPAPAGGMDSKAGD
jgi:zinc protease